MPGISITELSVLVVEPSHVQHKIIANRLRRAGVTSIIEADDGSSALRCLQADHPDLVVSSLYLPDMSGTDLVHAIRNLSGPASDTAFMLISSETRFRYLDPIRQAGAVGILPKPFSDEELDIALSTTLDLVDPDDRLELNVDAESLKVLLVDDSPFARKHIARVLQSIGIQDIDYAGDGREALTMVNEGYYDFVVTDYNMPVMDGQELVDRIRHTSTQASIPILMVTSEENENRLAAVQRSGVSAICDKPFEPATVRHMVENMLNGLAERDRID